MIMLTSIVCASFRNFLHQVRILLDEGGFGDGGEWGFVQNYLSENLPLLLHLKFQNPRHTSQNLIQNHKELTLN